MKCLLQVWSLLIFCAISLAGEPAAEPELARSNNGVFVALVKQGVFQIRRSGFLDELRSQAGKAKIHVQREAAALKRLFQVPGTGDDVELLLVAGERLGTEPNHFGFWQACDQYSFAYRRWQDALERLNRLIGPIKPIASAAR